MWLEVVLGIITLGVIFYLYRKWKINTLVNYWKQRGVRAVNISDVVSMWQIFRKQKTFLDLDNDFYRLTKKNKFAGFVNTSDKELFVGDLELLKHIFIKDFDHFVDRRMFTVSSPKEKCFNRMLTNLSGKEWKDMRSIMSPTFTTGKIKRMFETFNQCGERLKDFAVSQKKSSDGNGHLVIIQSCTYRYAVDVIAATAFGIDVGSLKDPDSMFYKMARRISDIGLYRKLKFMIMMISLKLFQMMRLSFSDTVGLNFFVKTLEEVLKQRKQSNEKRDDFLQLMIERSRGELTEDDPERLDAFEKEAMLKNENQQKGKLVLSDDDISSQSILFFSAGFDTVANLVNFLLYILAADSEIQEKIRKEIETTCTDSNGKWSLTYDGVNSLKYLDMLISETLRRYTPAFRTERSCTRDYRIPGTDVTIEKGTYVLIPVHAIHMDEEYFPNPEKFDPERFSDENKDSIPSLAYMPFGHGPRNCIGMRFALIESKVAIAHIIHNFKLEPTDKTPLPVQYDKNLGFNRAPPDLEVKFVPITH